MTDPAVFRANLRRIRESQGVTQTELGRRMRMKQHYISDLEKGKRNPTLATICALGKALGVPAADLLAETPGRQPRKNPSAAC